MELQIQELSTDFLIIGGGTAGCWAALAFCGHTAGGGRPGQALIVEKADIRRSGCLAAGVNALNAYIAPGKTPQDYVDYARADAEGIARGDLLLTMAKRLNGATAKLEALGLTVLKDEQGKYATRGWRNVKINGENIKPILAGAVMAQERASVLNRVNVLEYIVEGGRVLGACAVSIDEPILHVIYAKAVLCATGGAAGLYRPNHPGFSRHKMWYPPFNTGAGLAMGIRAGAEMTTLEMRFIALRCKDTIAPTGTLAQGAGAKQVNALGEMYEHEYGVSTSQRLHGTVTENLEGRGPCYLKTTGISPEQEADLQKAYLNMAPSQTLRWLESGKNPREQDVEIEGTEPYIVGGHTASGYWVSTDRETTIKGLFAAGDVAGGCPQKYVTGALAEGEIAALAAARYIDGAMPTSKPTPAATAAAAEAIENIKKMLESHFDSGDNGGGSAVAATADELEAEMQAVMDIYAGGIVSSYRFNDRSLKTADMKIQDIARRAEALRAEGMQELSYILELQERLVLCRSVIAHLAARKETRWHSFAEHEDFPERGGEWECYVNSILDGGEIKTFTRPLVGEDEIYEH